MHTVPSDDDEHHPYSLVRTVDGATAFCAGVIPATADGDVETDPEAAIETTIRNLEDRLAKAGASLRDVVKVTVFLTDLSWRPILDEAWRRTWDAPRPARTAIEVRRLPRDVGIEMDAIVHCPA